MRAGEIVETDAGGSSRRYYVHGVSYIDERLMMRNYNEPLDTGDDRSYYYTLDRMYNVRGIIDRAGALVERYAYDPYGRPLIRESAGRGDFDTNTDINSTDSTRYSAVLAGIIFDPRADMNDDGVVDSSDTTPFNYARDHVWTEGNPTVSQAFSDVDNPFGFQGRVHFALDTSATATEGNLMLVDQRLRMNDPVQGRWLTRDPIGYLAGSLNLYQFVDSQPTYWYDPFGLACHDDDKDEEEEEEDCLKNATEKADKDLEELKKEGYSSASNDYKLWHCLNSCRAQKECFGGPEGAKKAAAAAAAATLLKGGTAQEAAKAAKQAALAGAKINFWGGVTYEVGTAIGYKWKDGKFVPAKTYDQQDSKPWLIDTPGDVVANTIGILAGLAGADCKEACKAAHKIPGPNYDQGLKGKPTGDPNPPIGSGKKRPPNPPPPQPGGGSP